MRNTTLRVGGILLIIILAVFTPVVWSGYSEWKQAETAAPYTEIAKHYLIAAKRLPWQPGLYELAGTAHYHAKEYSQANSAYQEAFQRGALSAEGWVAWGDVNYLNGDHPRAAEIWKQGISQQNPSKNLYSRLARIYAEDKDYSTAAKYLQKYVPNHPEDAYAHYQLGLLLTLSDPNEALSQLLNASQLDPQFDPAVQTLRTTLNLSALSDTPSERLVIIGRGLGLVNEWELAHAAFEEAVKDNERNAEAWAWLGEANQQTGKNGSEELNQALSLNPNSSTVRGLRGLYFQRIGNNREALVEFQTAAQLEPDNPAWVISIGESYSKLGDLIRALEAYQYATMLAPDDIHYYLLLAGFCAQNDINLDDAGIPAAQKAVQLAPEDPHALDMLGWLYTMSGRDSEAEAMLSTALEHDPKLASGHYHLALLYLQKGDYVSMHNHLIQARDLGDNDAQILLNQYFP